jgi:hypothetical protein
VIGPSMVKPLLSSCPRLTLASSRATVPVVTHVLVSSLHLPTGVTAVTTGLHPMTVPMPGLASSHIYLSGWFVAIATPWASSWQQARLEDLAHRLEGQTPRTRTDAPDTVGRWRPRPIADRRSSRRLGQSRTSGAC